MKKTPATLFLEQYIVARSWTASQRTSAILPDATYASLCNTLLSNDDGEEAYRLILQLMSGKIAEDEVLRGRVLGALSEIDKFVYAIHPRALSIPTLTRLPDWLRDVRAQRSISGHYVLVGNDQLIPRGPLLRGARIPFAASADVLADRFSALSVVPLNLEHDDRVIPITVKTIGVDPLAGVATTSRPGSEKVGYLPVITSRTDVDIKSVPRGGGFCASFGPAGHFDAGQVAFEGITSMGDIDVAVMPELVFSEQHADNLSRLLSAYSGKAPRLLVGATYSTSKLNPEGQPWNECRMLNGVGKEIWRQRKIWPAAVSQATAIAYGLPDFGYGSFLPEDNASSEEIIVSDVDGFGRCVVLICQDIETPVFSTALIYKYQPDWVFIPIFDVSIDPGRWAHFRAVSLSSLSQARFIAVSNIAFSSKPEEGMGYAVGPKEPVDGSGALDIKRATIIVKKPSSPHPAFSVIQWRDSDWEQSSLTVSPVVTR